MDQAILQQFGNELRVAREASGRSVDEIARQTRIHRRYIDAIEAGDLSALPPGPYVPAFLREFARAVGLKVPSDLAIHSSINHGLTTTTVQSAPIVKNQQANASLPDVVTKATLETARLAGNVAKSAYKTTETVIKGVGEGAKETLDVFTSRSLREEAEMVRRERLGLVSPEEVETSTSSEIELENEEARATFDRRDRSKLAIKAPVIPLEITAEDPIAGQAVLKLGKKSRKYPVTNLVILALLLVFGTVAYLAIQSYSDKKKPTVQETSFLTTEAEDELTLAEVTNEAAPEAKPAAEAAGLTAPASTMPIDDSLRFSLTASDVVWISIGSDTMPPFRGEIKAGETKVFTAAKRFVVNLGNQKALDMMFNGTKLSALPTIKNSGMVVRNLVLTRDRVSLNGADVNTKATVASTNSTAKPGAAAVAKKPAASTSTNHASTVKATAVPIKKAVATTPKPGTAKTTAKTPKKSPPVKTIIPSVEPVLPTAN